MSSNDFAVARSGLSNALGVISPILTALQQADTIFGVLANAEKHKNLLETEVADYKDELNKAQEAIDKQQEKLQESAVLSLKSSLKDQQRHVYEKTRLLTHLDKELQLVKEKHKRETLAMERRLADENKDLR